MFERIGRGVVHHPWLTIVAWFVVTAAVVLSAPQLSTTQDQADFLPSTYESAQAAEIAEEAFPEIREPAAILVFKHADGTAMSDSDVAAASGIVDQLDGHGYDDVDRITLSEQVSADGTILIANLEPRADSDDVIYGETLMDSIKELRSDAAPLLEGTGLQLGVTGDTAMMLDDLEATGDIDQLIMMATLVLIVVLLLLIFRSPVIALLPIASIALVMIASTGLISWASEMFGLQVDTTINQLLIIVLFGVGADYFIFLMFRYRERLRAGIAPRDAMIQAVGRVGEAITSAAAVVIIAFLALSLSTLGQLRAWGPALAIAVAVTLAAGLTLVPAVVSLFGSKVFWPSRSWQHTPKERISSRLGNLVARRPKAVVVTTGLLLAALALGATGFVATFDQSGGAPDSESARALSDLEEGFSAGETRPTDVLVRSTADTTLDAGAVEALADRIGTVDGVARVAPPVFNEAGTAAQVSVVLDAAPSSEAALSLVRGELRDVVHAAAPADTEAYVGGLTSVLADVEDAVNVDYKVVFPVAGLLILIVLALLLRSLVAPWYLMGAVALGFLASLGTTVIVFQGFMDEPGLLFSLPLMMYLFVVAIGTDYNILMVARLREEARAGHAPRAAASLAVRHTAPTIAVAGLILAGTFGVLMLAENATLQQMGFGIAIGIVLVAFVMAILLTPALTALIGHRAWWPGHQDRPTGPAARAADVTPEQPAVPLGSRL
ncbi:MMPL family transporter [Nocardioides alcanivorans]|uniref:MMPL family transporter n=1 Tax=Nocardioides alcanivorans TaxID=2897352 RepID=UPI001F2210AC|nr:MMPL family transporter [Nocardioides alcanivorans]